MADFGLARAFGIPVKKLTHEVVTLWYRAPDILLGSQHYGTAVDIWSVGCIFAEMVNNGQPLVPGKTEDQQLLKIFKLMGVPSASMWFQLNDLPNYKQFMADHAQELEKVPPYDPSGKTFEKMFPTLSPEGIDLMNRMLQYDPGKRISAAETLQHPFFKEIIEQQEKLLEKQQQQYANGEKLV